MINLARFRSLLNREVLDRRGRIRYYSGFNLDGFFKGYETNKFDKSKMSREKHVWFYLGIDLVTMDITTENMGDAGSNRDYFLYFIKNYLLKRGLTIRSAAGSALSRLGSRSIVDNEPCVFSGLIPFEEVTHAGSYPSWFCSVGSSVAVDTLYQVYGTLTNVIHIKKIVDISDRL